MREDRIRHPDGSDGLYGVVERSDFVVIAPMQDGRLTLVEQFRYPVSARMWEFPMGMWEQGRGLTRRWWPPANCARKPGCWRAA